MDSPVRWCCCYVSPLCTESDCVSSSVTCFVTMASTQYFLRIPRQNNFIIARKILTFVMI